MERIDISMFKMKDAEADRGEPRTPDSRARYLPLPALPWPQVAPSGWIFMGV